MVGNGDDYMKLTNLSKAGYCFGFFLFLATELRYFVLNPDLDKALFFGLISIIIMVISFIWNKLVGLANTLDDVETYLADKNRELEE